jgi:hypothetical protein
VATSELFTVSYWEVLGAQVIHAAAGGAAGALVSAGLGTIGDVPWYGVLSAGVISGATTLLLGLAGKLNPNTGPATLFVPPPAAAKRANHPAAKAASSRKPRP